MIMLFNTEGRFAHQLTQLAALIGNAVKYNTTFYQHAISQTYSADLNIQAIVDSGLMVHPLNTFVRRKLWMYKLLRLLSFENRHFNGTQYYLRPGRDQELLSGDACEVFSNAARLPIATDYILNDIPTMLKYRDEIVELIKPHPALDLRIQEFLAGLRKKFEIILGLHVRWGDYRNFQHGRFYFTDSEYSKIVDRFSAVVDVPADKIALIVCCEEPVELQLNMNYAVYNESRSYAEDLFLMKECDYLIGPHSMFSLMANYLGQSKLYQVFSPQKKYRIQDFHTCRDLLESRYGSIRSVDELQEEAGNH